MVRQSSYMIPFRVQTQEEAPAAANDLFDANINPAAAAFTQSLLTIPHGTRGVLKHVQVWCDSANARAYHLYLGSISSANPQEQLAAIFFDSNEYLGVTIADSTLETFEVDIPFFLETNRVIYHSLYSAAGAFGTVVARLAYRGILYV